MKLDPLHKYTPSPPGAWGAARHRVGTLVCWIKTKAFKWLYKKKGDEMQRTCVLLAFSLRSWVAWCQAQSLQMASLSCVLSSEVVERGNCLFPSCLSMFHPHLLVNTTSSSCLLNKHCRDEGMKIYCLLNFFTKLSCGCPPWLFLISLVTSYLLFLALCLDI